jgi:hypothetical protein
MTDEHPVSGRERLVLEAGALGEIAYLDMDGTRVMSLTFNASAAFDPGVFAST